MALVPRAVAADRDGREIEWPQPLADVGQRFRVAGVAGKEEALAAAGHDPRGPQPQILIAQRATRRVLRRRAGERQAAKLLTFPPVHLDDVRDAEVAHPRPQSERNEE